LEQFFESRFAWDYHASISFEDFMKKMTKILDLTPEEVREAFEALDVAKSGSIVCNEMIFTLQSYLKNA